MEIKIQDFVLIKASSEEEYYKIISDEITRVNMNEPFNKHSCLDHIRMSDYWRKKINQLEDGQLFRLTVQCVRKSIDSLEAQMSCGIHLLS